MRILVQIPLNAFTVTILLLESRTGCVIIVNFLYNTDIWTTTSMV